MRRTRRGRRACSAFLSRSSPSVTETNVYCRFKGSEDYIRTKFEEYVSAALSSVKYADFLAKGAQNGVLISGTFREWSDTL